jgi:hypothetical protein
MKSASVLKSTVPQEADSMEPGERQLKESYAKVPCDLIGSNLPSPRQLAEPKCPLI